MVKIADTYNPITGEYVKKISDWKTLDGGLFAGGWVNYASGLNGTRSVRPNVQVLTNALDNVRIFRHDSVPIKGFIQVPEQSPYMYLTSELTGWNHTMNSANFNLSINEIKAYFYGWKMCNSDSTSPYYKSEVPYTPATWAEWSASGGGVVNDSSGITFTSDGVNWMVSSFYSSLKSSTKYGILYNVVSSSLSGSLFFVSAESFGSGNIPKAVGNQKSIDTTISDTTGKKFSICTGSKEPLGNQIKIKDFRIFELPTGSQIEADFTSLSADELSVKYTFNGLCVKHWKKVTDGTGLTSTRPTSSYEGYTPYRMIYQLATPEISYLTPKATIPLYDTNTIVETNTPSDCKADVTVGYKLKDGVTAVAGDITAPTPDYMSAVNSVSENGLGKGVVRSPNIVTNGNFANGTTGWVGYNATVSVANNTAILTGNGLAARAQINNPLGIFRKGQKLYFKASVRSLDSDATLINVWSDGATTSYSLSNPVKDQWYNLSGISTSITNGSASTFVIGVTYADASSALGKKSEIKSVMCIDLTASFGAGNEPTKEQCDILFATWQDKASTQATLPTLRKIGTVADTYNPETGVLVQRIGKKVFDGTEAWGSYIGGDAKNFVYNLSIGDAKVENQTSQCSHFKNVNSAWSTIGLGTYCDHPSVTQRYFQTNIPTVAQFKAYLAQQYANGTPVTVYYQLATPVVTTFTKTALPTYKPTTVIESDSTVKGNVSADYKLKVGATPVDGDFIASPEAVNDIKDLGNSIDVVSSVGRRNLLLDSDGLVDMSSNNSNLYPISISTMSEMGKKFYRIKREMISQYTKTMSMYSTIPRGIINVNEVFDSGEVVVSFKARSNINIESSIMANTYGDTTINGDNFNSIISISSEWKTFYTRFSNIPSEGTSGLRVNPFDIKSMNSEIISEFYIDVCDWKIERGSSPTEYIINPENIPYNTTTNGVYKTNILLGAPLRSVGAVKDRLFKDSDGKWKVERNIGKVVLNGTEGSYGWISGFGAFYTPTVAKAQGTEFKCSHYSYKTSTTDGADRFCYANAGSSLQFWFSDRFYTSQTQFKTWVAQEYSKGTPVTIEYKLATPTYETLSQELQTDLDNIPTFPEHNYVYTVVNDNLQPTLHVDYKKLSWLRSRLLVNSLKIYSRNLTDAEMIQNYKVEKERFGM